MLTFENPQKRKKENGIYWNLISESHTGNTLNTEYALNITIFSLLVGNSDTKLDYSVN